MLQNQEVLTAYLQILEQVVLSGSSFTREQALASAFELGRSLLSAEITPERIAGLHQSAIIELGKKYPNMQLGLVAERLSLPLIELTMAHGMVYREYLQQRQQAELASRLEKSSRLEALGTLAAGIAHDFNTLLGSIHGYAELTEDELAEGSPARKYQKQISIACQRARGLIERMLAFARQAPLQPIVQELGVEIEEAILMLHPGLAKDIQINFENETHNALVLADQGQIQQIVLNLCLNAAEAMNYAGILQIRLVYAAEYDSAPKGRDNNYCLSVIDSGCGMPPEIQARIFEPFFTTKSPHGNGLGLSVVYGIVKQLGGEIVLTSCSSGLATGTNFQIFLPPFIPVEVAIQQEGLQSGSNFNY